MSESPSSQVGAPEAVPPEGEPCPTPLSWRQVVDAFGQQAAVRDVEHDGRTLRCHVLGDGPPLYLLGGAAGTAEQQALLAWLLREDFRCVIVEDPAPGFRGRCRARSSTEFARGLLAAADELGDARFDVVAVSVGTAIALRAAVECPDRVGRCVLVNPFAERRLSPAERLALRVLPWLPGRLDHVPGRRAIQAQNHVPWFPPYDGSRWQFYVEETGRVPLRVLGARTACVRDSGLSAGLPEVRQPVLIVRTEGEGRVAGEAAEEVEAKLPRAKVEWFHNCGHLAHLTHPHRLAKAVRGFLSEESESVAASAGRT